MKLNPQHAPLNILLADDDIDDRSFFEKALKEIPVATKLVMVNNGEELMDFFYEHPADLPDILFLDLSMPQKTGFECLSEIKENEKLKDIYVVMFTTSFTLSIDFEEKLMDTLTGMGAQDYIRKPGGFKELKKLIQKVLADVIEKRR